MNDHQTGTTLPEAVSVLVAGAGPAGLATALELGRRGVAVLVLEPRAGVSHDRPRAKTTSVRTMEYFRRWGIAERLREAAPLPVAWSQDAIFVSSLLGREVTRFHDCFGMSTTRRDEFAESGQQVPQPVVEQVLREAVAGLPNATVATGWSLTGLAQTPDDVVVDASHVDGAIARVRARYVLGCDGPASATRKALGVSYVGTADVRSNFNLVFRAPGLGERVPHGPGVHYWILDPNAPGLLGRLDLGDTWWGMAMGVDADRGNADPVGLARALIGTGADDIEIEVVSTDPWSARMLVADSYGSGRVFLVGDSAHQNPPWGGHGFNTAVGDAVNIGWKLAAVLEGWGGDELLPSYEAERRPIAQQTIDLATKNMGSLSTDFANAQLGELGPSGDEARATTAMRIQVAKDSEFHSLGLVLGHHYGDSPVVVPDGTPELPHDPLRYLPSARPGARLPHTWLPGGRSIYDLLGPALTLLRLDGDADPSPFVAAAALARNTARRGRSVRRLSRLALHGHAVARATRPARRLAEHRALGDDGRSFRGARRRDRPGVRLDAPVAV